MEQGADEEDEHQPDGQCRGFGLEPKDQQHSRDHLDPRHRIRSTDYQMPVLVGIKNLESFDRKGERLDIAYFGECSKDKHAPERNAQGELEHVEAAKATSPVSR